MAIYNIPPDDDPVAAWVAQVNYFAELYNETFARDQADLEECPCVLPEHSCPSCRAAARRVYGRDYARGV